MRVLPHPELLWEFQHLPDQFVVVDTLTTGLFDDGGAPGCISIGVCLVENGGVVDGAEYPVRPHRELQREAARINGCSPESVQAHPSVEAQWPQLLPWLDGQFVVALNAEFDWGVLEDLVTRYRLSQPRAAGVFCTQRGALPWALANGLPCTARGPSLRTLSDALGQQNECSLNQGARRALVDCRQTAAVACALRRQWGADESHVSESVESAQAIGFG